MYAPVKIACIQIAPFYRDVAKNLEKAEHYLLEAAENGAGLIVLPEIFNVGSSGQNRGEAYELSEAVPDGETTRFLLRIAKEKKVYICGSILERDGVDLYNTALLVGPDGFIGKYRKMHLTTKEVYYYEKGNLGIPVFHTPIGRIALLICLDSYYPEAFRIAALEGADVVCVPYAAMDLKEKYNFPEGMHTLVPSLCMTASCSNHIYVVGCNRTGNCNGYQSAGQSIITNATGGLSCPIAPYDKEVILYAEVDLSKARDKYNSTASSYFASRRTDVYSADLGYKK